MYANFAKARIALCLTIFERFERYTGASVVTAVWTYVGELAFNLLVLVGAIKGCDRIVKEIMGL